MNIIDAIIGSKLNGGSGTGGGGGSGSSGGGARSVRLVADITIDQTNIPATIEVTEDMDGNPFELRDFIIECDVSTGVSYSVVQFNGNTIRSILIQKSNSAAEFRCEIGDNYYYVWDNRAAEWKLITAGASTPAGSGVDCGLFEYGCVRSILVGATYPITKVTYFRVWEVVS